MHLILTFCAKYLFVVVGLIAAFYWLYLPKKLKIKVVVFGVIVALAALLLTKAGGAVFYDPRPFVTHQVIPLFPHAADNGFPSDHTVLTASIAIAIYSVSKKLGTILMVMALLIGLSRIIGYIHTPIDIVGSLIFALVGGVVASYFTPKILAHIKVKE